MSPPSDHEFSEPVGMIGLGLLGTALAERLLNAGYELHVFNRTRSKAEPLLSRGARWSDNPFKTCRRVVVCLWSTDIVGSLLERFTRDTPSDRLVIDATTGAPDQTIPLAHQLAERGVEYLECPIVASSEQTRRGEALAIISGRESSYEKAKDLVQAVTGRAVYVGPWGNAAKLKLVNNLVLGLNRAALAESLGLARALGLDPQVTLDVIRQGSAYSTVMDVKGSKMVDHEFSPQAKLAQHLKDVELMLGAGQNHGLALPLSATHQKILSHLVEMGYGDEDNSAVMRAYEIGPRNEERKK